MNWKGGTISKRTVRARKHHTCSCCYSEIVPGEEYTRLFGSSGYGEKPYVVSECQWCQGPNRGQNRTHP